MIDDVHNGLHEIVQAVFSFCSLFFFEMLCYNDNEHLFSIIQCCPKKVLFTDGYNSFATIRK